MKSIITAAPFFLFLTTVTAQLPAANGTDAFWAELNKLCGKAYAGTVAAAPEGDTTFKDKRLVMHVRACATNTVRIPFVVGDDRSRTWVLTRRPDGILLKHDHRHQDGKPDAVTNYGGFTPNNGSESLQVFPADRETAALIPAASGNVWWIELKPGEFFSYNLRRIGTDRYFSVRFDLKNDVVPPEPPWGWAK